ERSFLISWWRLHSIFGRGWHRRPPLELIDGLPLPLPFTEAESTSLHSRGCREHQEEHKSQLQPPHCCRQRGDRSKKRNKRKRGSTERKKKDQPRREETERQERRESG